MRLLTRSNSRGQGLVEFAVIFPLFAFFLFAIIDGGLLFGRYGDVNNAAKEGARLAVVDPSVTAVVTRVRQQTHGILDSASTACGDWDTQPKVICVESVSGAEGQSAGDIGSSIRVKVKYHYTLLTPLFSLFGAVDPSWDVKACALQRVEQVSDSTDIPAASGSQTCDG